MPKRILVKAPGRVTVAGRQYQFGTDEVGKTLLLPDHEAEMILEGPSKHNFKFIATEPDGLATSIHQLSVTAVVKPTKKLTPITKHADWATPYARGTTPDPIYFKEPEPVKAEEVVEPVKAEEVKDVKEDLVEDKPFVSPEKPVEEVKEVTLDPKAHWSKVKTLLAEVEESYPIDYALVKRIKEVYPRYDAIQKECDRILKDAE